MMFLTLDLSSEIPLYQQIHDRIIEAIAAGQLTPDIPLPPSRQLASDFGINFHTVNKAYDLLRQEGFVQRTRKRGTFVLASDQVAAARRYPPDWDQRARTLLADATAQGIPADEILRRCQQILTTFGATANTETSAEGGRP
jgi:GntR family transcriptional regulator